MLIKQISKYFTLFIILTTLGGCYSFSGSSIDPSWQTIEIPTIQNRATLQNPNLSQQLTNDLQDIFRSRTKLNLTNDGGDLILIGEITDYRVSSVAIETGDVAGSNRLTITLAIQYENNMDESKSFNKSFSEFEDFEANKTLQEVEDNLVQEISTKLKTQIFNAIAMDW